MFSTSLADSSFAKSAIHLHFGSSLKNEKLKNKKSNFTFDSIGTYGIDGNTKFSFREYIGKIIKLLKNDGLLMWETVSPDTYEPKRFQPKLDVLLEQFSILSDKMVKSEYPINVPERRFLVLSKNRL